MKIAFLSHSAMSVYHFRMPLIKALLARGDEVFVLVPNDDFVPKLKALNLKFKIIIYELNRSSVNPFVVLKNAFKLYQIIKTLNIDLIQSAAHKSNTLGIIIAKIAGVKYTIALVEGLGSFYIDKDFKSQIVRLGIEFLYKLAFKCVHKMIFVNQSNAVFMQNLGLTSEKIVIIQSVGVNLKRFFPFKITKEQKQAFIKEYNLNPHTPIVLMVARALWHKGVGEFYQAAAFLEKKANFIFVGGCDEHKSSASLSFLQRGKVCYLGLREDIAFLLNLCDIFVLPSYKEGFPQSVLEAKACAKACVLSEVEGCEEIITNNIDGLFCKVKDSLDLAQKIELLLVDKALRINLGQNAFKDALNYDENIIVKKYLKLYDTLLYKA